LRRPDLAATVRWFQASVVQPHELRRRTRLAPAASVIRPSPTLRPRQRVEIYAGGYLARLTDALHEDFPALTRLLGPRAFPELCRAYLERHPSRSWSLNPLGRKLPEFLSGRVKVSRREAARDLARLEVAMSEVFDGEGVEPLKPADFAKIPAAKLAAVRVKFVPTFQLLALDHAVNPYVDAVRAQRRDLPPLRRKRSWIAVYRKGFQVWRLDLEEGAHAALAALLRGRSVGAAVAAATRLWKGKPGDLQTLIRQWFGEWVSEGFFAKILPR